ncbi:uncharacterized protein LOC120631302 isoform X1 [Pararge aegeria]|uniref:uncharacterized protein LOC120631302 isoform X1 n=1 Tax=Pararge aegeria TaxID=116150 RepID=UPI0019CF62FF|nr:uncharacterized protein LOC120631302 isoform X1 [Pararge aegeria]
MRDDEPPLLPASPGPHSAPERSPGSRPTRFKRALSSLRSSFRSGSPFHFASLKRSGSTKSSVSDSEIVRGERTMRRKNKKQRADSANAASSRSTDSSPSASKKKTGLLKRMSTIGKRRVESSTPSSTDMDPELDMDPDIELESDSKLDEKPILEMSLEPEKQEPPPTDNSEQNTNDPVPESGSPEPPFITLAVEHPVAMRCFTKEAWKRRSKTEIQKPIEESGPGDSLKRRIAFVAQTSPAMSEDRDDDDDDDDEDAEEGGGEVGSLEEAVALARQRLALAAQSSAPPQSTENNETEEEGCADTMPAYGDLIEPEHKAENDDESAHATASAERREHLYKILVIGELGTGKTSIIKRYVHQFFSQHYRATIGVDFALKVLNWDANTIIRLQLWDIAGQERFGNMTRVYYKEAVGAFIVFDVSRVATFDAVVKWKNDLDTKVQLPDGSPIPCILLANKCDQQKEGIVNSPTKMDEYCREKGFAGWFETSAKENINIEEAARSLVNKILLNDKLLQSNDKDGEKFALDHKIANGENNREANAGKFCAC